MTMGPLRVIAVTSGKGGVGKSHFAANVGAVFARSGARSLLIDADAGLSSLDLLLGLKPTKTLVHLLEGASLDEVLVRAPEDGPWLLPAASGVQHLTRLSDAERAALFSAWDELTSRFDVILLDCGPGVGDDVLFYASVAHQVVLVMSGEPTSVADAAVLAQTLAETTAVRELSVVVNATRSERMALEVFDQLGGLLEGGALPRLRYLGAVPDDQNVRRATLAQRPVVRLAPYSPASRAFERLVKALSGQSVPLPGGGLQLGMERLLRRPTPDDDARVVRLVRAP